MHTSIVVVLLSLLLNHVGVESAGSGTAIVNPNPPAPSQELYVPSGEDDPDMAELWIDDISVNEAEATATFTVSKIGRSDKKVRFSVATVGATATEGTDFVDTKESFSLPGKKPAATATFTVPIIDDSIAEGTEAFSAVVYDVEGALLMKGAGVASISDNDTAAVIADLHDGLVVVEGGAADTFDIALGSEPTAPVFVLVSVPDHQLAANPANLRFDATDWASPQQVAITALADGIDEPDPQPMQVSIDVESDDEYYAAVSVPPLDIVVGDADALLVTISGPAVGAVGYTSTFEATVNNGGIGTVTFQWTAFQQGTAVASGDQANFDFTPPLPGQYIVHAIVGDDKGQNPAEFIHFEVLSDVGDSIFADDIIWLREEGITGGCSADGLEFCPEDYVTRGQLAAFLVRYLDLTAAPPGNVFTDDDGSIFEEDIARLAAAGISSGCNTDGTMFCPNANLTRGQMAALLTRALDLPPAAGGDLFTDDDGSIFEDDIARVAAAGITTGCNPEGTRFCPDRFVTRGQMAAFLRRAAALLDS